MPVASLATRVGRGRGHHHDVGPPGGLDVLEPAARRACQALSSSSTPAPRHGGERERHDEALARLGGDHGRREALFGEQAHELDRLVDGDAAAHADEHVALRRMSFDCGHARPAAALSPCS